MPAQAGPSPSLLATTLRLPGVPHRTIRTVDVRLPPVPQVDAVSVLPVPVTSNHRPRRERMPRVGGLGSERIGFHSLVAPDRLRVTETGGE